MAQRLDRVADRLQSSTQTLLERASARISRAAAGLDALSPLRVLQRGYAVARSESGDVLRRREQFPAGMNFRITVSDGDVRATVPDSPPPLVAPAKPRRRK